MLSRAGPRAAPPRRANREETGQRIEFPFLCEECSVGLPPVARQKPGHHPIAAAAVPDEDAAGLQYPRKLPDDTGVVGRVRKEPEGREQVHYRIETSGPARGHFAHVAARVSERSTSSTSPRHCQQLLRVVQSIDVEAILGQQVCVTTLTARNIENARAGRQTKQVDEPSYLLSIALGREERPVLLEIVGVESGLPPLELSAQKNTGSR